MENASEALIMAAGVLIGVMILTLAVYLFVTFGAQSQELHKEITANQLTQYNAQYNVYEGRTNITIYQIISVKNLAKENEKRYKDYTDYNELYEVKVFLDNDEIKSITDQELLSRYMTVDANGELGQEFSCISKQSTNAVEYHPNGRISVIRFYSNKNMEIT